MKDFNLKNKDSNSKWIFGFYLAFFFSIIGLFAGLLYPENTEERLTLIQGWKRGIIVHFIIIIFVIIVIISQMVK